MNAGTIVIYYNSSQRKIYGDDEELFKQPTTTGTIISSSDENYVIESSGFSLSSETVPKKYVRAARQIEWYEFWRTKGYWKSGWFYILFIIFFLLFVK